MRRKVRLMSLLLGVVFLCSSCGAVYLKPESSSAPDLSENAGQKEHADSQDSNIEIPTNFDPGVENRHIISSEFPSPDGEGSYIRGSVFPSVSYFDFDSGLVVPLCTQQGCQHQDESCLAYQGMLFDFSVYQGNWYALTSDKKGSNDDAHQVRLVRTDPKTNQRKTLWEYKDPDRTLSGTNLILSHGKAWFQLEAMEVVWNQDSEEMYNETLTEAKLISVDLETEEAQVFTPDDPTGRYQFWGGSEQGFAYTYSILEKQPISEEAFLKQHPDSTPSDYMDYYFNNAVLNTKHRLFYCDKTSGQDILICDNVQMSDSTCCYGDSLYYRVMDRSNGETQICSLDLTTGEKKLFWQDAWIVDYTTFDNKLFCITSSPDAQTNESGTTKADFYAIDLSTNEKYIVPNHGDEYVMYFRIDSETKEHFLGFCQGQSTSIRKKDFWAGHFENIEAVS